MVIRVGYLPRPVDLADPNLYLRKPMDEQKFWGWLGWEAACPDWTAAMLICYPDSEAAIRHYLQRLLFRRSLEHGAALVTAQDFLTSHAITDARPSLPHALFKLALKLLAQEGRDYNFESDMRELALVIELMLVMPGWLTPDQMAALGVAVRHTPSANDCGSALESLMTHPLIVDSLLTPEQQIDCLANRFMGLLRQRHNRKECLTTFRLLSRYPAAQAELITLLRQHVDHLSRDEWLRCVNLLDAANHPRLRAPAARILNRPSGEVRNDAANRQLLAMAYPQLRLAPTSPNLTPTE
jgi:hypothetical protein